MLTPAHHVEMIRTSDEGYPLASSLDEVIGCHLGSLVTIGGYG